jgi:acetoin:2,6-dichlorophenolindophenol oxidoreductase subunit alpha
MALTKKLAKELLTNLYRIRIADEEIAKVYPNDIIKCPVHLSTGSEGVPVGVCAALKKTDYAVGTHRSHGIFIAKGGSLNDFMAEMYGRENGCAGGKGGSMHLISLENGLLGTTPILGSTIPIGVGSALASRFKKDKSVTAIFFGDGSSEEGAFYESLNLAALFKVPALFVCENNEYSIFQELSIRQPINNLYKKGEVFGIPGTRVDGNDVVKVYEATLEAVKQVRLGKPVLLELMTTRWRQHVGPYYDHEIGFGTEEELKKKIKVKDPVKIFVKYLRKNDLLSEGEIESVENSVRKEVEDSFEHAQSSPLPKPSDLYKHLY